MFSHNNDCFFYIQYNCADVFQVGMHTRQIFKASLSPESESLSNTKNYPLTSMIRSQPRTDISCIKKI